VTNKQGSTAFEYNAKQWIAILGTVSPTQAADDALMLTVRQQLETAASGYLTLTHRHRTRFAKGSPAKQMLLAYDQIKAALDYAERTGNAPLKSILETALTIMGITTMVEGFDMMRLSHRRRADPARDLLHHLVLKAWTDTLAGGLTTGRKSDASPGNKREANSPAIRFLVAALKPLGIEIRPEMAKKLIEAEKKGRRGAQNAALQERRRRLAKTVAE
jgi:hypothetical protein